MTSQPTLFDVPMPAPQGSARRADPPTSQAAAKSLDTNKLEQLVVQVLRAHPAGLTSHEVAAHLGLSLVTVSPRMRPLVRKNLVVDSGEKRAGVGFMNSIVWKAR